MAVYQAKGKAHCREMKRQAWYYYKSSPFDEDFDTCLRIIIEQHRKEIEAEIIQKLKEQQNQSLEDGNDGYAA